MKMLLLAARSRVQALTVRTAAVIPCTLLQDSVARVGIVVDDLHFLQRFRPAESVGSSHIKPR
jgi:hypothetical protein